MKKIYQELAGLIIARQNCIKSQNTEWFNRHTDRIEEIIDKYLPSGSGIDSGNKIDLEKSTGEKIIIHSSYHNMDQNGFYDGWSEYKLVITPSLAFGFNLKIIGNFGKYQDTKEYLYNIYQESLNNEYIQEENQ